MIGVIITLSAFCIILMYCLCKQDDKNSALAAENGLLRGRIATMQEGAIIQDQSVVLNQPLSVEDIEAAIRYAGYDTETSNGFVSFKAEEKLFDIDITRLPAIGIICDFTIDGNKWDIELMKKAAHLMSDEIMMVKAIFIENKEETILRFLIVCMDHNYISFRDNLKRYIGIINDGDKVLKEKYHNLEEEQNHPSLSETALLPFRYGA